MTTFDEGAAVMVEGNRNAAAGGVLPRVAVLLAAYNGMAYIREQVESILTQAGVDVTIFFSVDRSTDGTECWVAELVAQEPRAVLLPYGERFGGAARNFFHLVKEVDFSAFDFVALADQDDIWLPEKLFRAVEVMRQHQADACSGNVLAFWPDGREVVVNKAQPQVSHDFLFEAAGPGCTYVFSVPSALRMKAFMVRHWKEVNEVSLHDWFFYAWYRANGLRWHIDSRWAMRYRQHGNNQVGANEGLGALLRRLKLMWSGWYATEVARISRLVAPATDEVARAACAGGWRGRLGLLQHVGELRRRARDRLFLFVMIILGVY